MQITVLALTAAVMLLSLIVYIVSESPLIPSTTRPASNVIILHNSSAPLAESTNTVSSLGEAGKKVNINTATAEQLMQVVGIGETLAARIIAYRKVYGDFTDIAQLKEIKGIGEKKYREIKEQLTVSR